jgi:ABC-type sugar transport system permease subunit
LLKGRSETTSFPRHDARLAAWLVLPAFGTVALVAVFPLGWTLWESFHRHDLRLPWLGRPFVAMANYGEAATDPRFWSALAHTLVFTAVSVTLEVALGLLLALMLQRSFRGLGWVRTLTLLPWAIPTVIAALLWRFLFEGPSSPANALLIGLGIREAPLAWLAHPVGAWLPILAADVWKTTPFVALLLLAGLQSIDESLHEAARVDGAGPWQELFHVTLPLLKPALAVVLVFRSLDAFRVFDLIYVMTGGGPATATESVALYTFAVLMQQLRFGYGSALAMLVFGVGFVLALLYVRLLGTGPRGATP